MHRILCLFLFIVPLMLTAQNVGIGTNSPTEKLQVNGNILIDTAKLSGLVLTPNAGAGKVLTSNAAGNATWENLVAPPGGDNNDNIGYGVWGDCEMNGNIGSYQPVVDTAAIADRWFGNSVSVSGSYAAVGTPFDNLGIAGQGSVSMFFYNGISWELVQKLTDSDAEISDHFGFSLSLAGEYLLISSPDDNDTYTDQGSISFFHFNGSAWEFMEKIYEHNPQINQYFGTTVSLSNQNAIVGSPYDNLYRGSASVYQFDGEHWQLVNQIEDPSGMAQDFFGSSVSISDEWALVGANGDKVVNNSTQGSASLFHFDGTQWVFTQKLFESSGSPFDQFGSAVALGEGELMIGIPGDDATYTNQGSVKLYRWNGTDWLARQTMIDYGCSQDASFGGKLILSYPYAMVSSTFNKPPGIPVAFGSVTIYHKIGLGWQKFQTVFDPGGASDLFGFSIGLDGPAKHFAVGVPYYGSYCGKVVFGKIK